jgi:hypothetical protein
LRIGIRNGNKRLTIIRAALSKLIRVTQELLVQLFGLVAVREEDFIVRQGSGAEGSLSWNGCGCRDGCCQNSREGADDEGGFEDGEHYVYACNVLYVVESPI